VASVHGLLTTAGRWWQCRGGDESRWGRSSSPRERERRVGMGVVEDGRGSPHILGPEGGGEETTSGIGGDGGNGVT
jgi:hypothetical protein